MNPDLRGLDVPELTPANENPWYVLMTLYGEQTGAGVDWALHIRNRAAWNAWSCQRMGEEDRANAAASSGVTVAELSAWPKIQEEVERLHLKEMVRRNGEVFDYRGMPPVGFTVNCSDVMFDHHLIVKMFVFAWNTRFNEVKFDGQVWFDDATFCGSAEFLGAAFDGHAGFERAVFNTDVMFGGATFSGRAGFNGAVFGDYAGFNETVFEGTAWFISATFREILRLAGATFRVDAHFHDARFGAGAIFRGATFGGFANFQRACFGLKGVGQVDDFTDCQFEKPISFQDAVFQSSYPDFSGTILHDKTKFNSHGDNWPKGPQDDLTQAKACCAVIRHNLGKQGLPEAEHFFYRREMGFAGQIGGWWQRLPYRVFGWLSDYGYSIERPVWALFWVWLVPSVLFAACWIVGQIGPDLKELGRGMAFSFANLFTVFGLHKLWFSAIWLEHLWWPLKVLGGAQTVVSLPLLFFLGLGLRTRFRLR